MSYALAIATSLLRRLPCGQSLCDSLCGVLQMTTRREQMREDARFRILRLLQENPEMSQRDLAQAVGISTGDVNYVPSALVHKGLIKLGNFTAAEHKHRYAHVLTSKGIAEKARLTRAFLARKMNEYEALRAEIEAVCAEIGTEEARESKA